MNEYSNIQSRHIRLLICLLLISAILLVYWQVTGFDFVSIDDSDYVTQNSNVQSGLTLKGITWAFTTFHASNWHPITWISHMLDCELYGLNPMGHHWTNVLLHILNTLLLFFLLNQMTGVLWRSAFVAALFALHPLHVESVAWISERKDVLSTFFGLLTIISYYRYTKRPYLGHYILAVILFALGLMTKPMLVTLPFVLLLLDYWPVERCKNLNRYNESNHKSSNFKFIVRIILEKIPFIILAAISSILTVFAQQSKGAIQSIADLSITVRIANAFVSYVSYIIKTIFPVNLAVFYPHPGNALPAWKITGSILSIVILLILSVLFYKKYAYVTVGWLWYLVTLLPVIGIIQVGDQAMADRYTYIPSIGLFIIMVWGINDISKKWRFRRIILQTFGGVALSLLMILAYFQSGYWKNSEILFTHAINVTHNNSLALNNLGVEMLNQGKVDMAIIQLKKALNINPDYVKARINLGAALLQVKKINKAVLNLKQALAVDPDNPTALLNLGRAYAVCNKNDEAISFYRKTLRVKPDFSTAHNNLAILLQDRGKNKEALYHFYQAVKIDPKNPVYSYNLTNFLIKEDKINKAVAHMSKSFAMMKFTDIHDINPYYAEVFNNLGVYLAGIGKFKEAEKFFIKAIQINPKYSKARHNLTMLKQ